MTETVRGSDFCSRWNIEISNQVIFAHSGWNLNIIETKKISTKWNWTVVDECIEVAIAETVQGITRNDRNDNSGDDNDSDGDIIIMYTKTYVFIVFVFHALLHIDNSG